MARSQATCHPNRKMVSHGLCPTCYSRKRREEHPEIWRKHSLNAQRKVRQAILDKYGRVCKKCGFSDERALQVDHVNGGGIEELASMSRGGYYRKVLEDTSGMYQLLCANCNWIKRSENNELRVFGAKVTRPEDGGLPEPGTQASMLTATCYRERGRYTAPKVKASPCVD